MNEHAVNGTAAFGELSAATSVVTSEMSSGRWCHSPHKDIVAPPYMPPSTRRATEPDLRRLSSLELLHAGGIWGWLGRGPRKRTAYSLGMRQALWAHFGGERATSHAMLISNKTQPDSLWATAKFCLATAGVGYGMRLGKAALLNCLPLIAQPFVVQALEDVLDYHTFSRRVSMEQLADLPQITRAVDGKQVATLRAALARVHRAYAWDEGGLAYEYTVLALCHRAVELRGSLVSGASACTAQAAKTPGALPVRRVPRWFPSPLRGAVVASIAERRRCYWRPRDEGC